MRNPNLGIPALEDGLFANLLIFDYVHVFRYFCKGEGREGKGMEKGREKGRGKKRQPLLSPRAQPLVIGSSEPFSHRANPAPFTDHEYRLLKAYETAAFMIADEEIDTGHQVMFFNVILIFYMMQPSGNI